MVRLSAERLNRISFASFKAAGCTDTEAERISELLVLANLRGHDSHGAGVYIPVYIQRIHSGMIVPGAVPEIVNETPAMALLNGNNGPGQTNATRGMKIAIEKAKNIGVGVVSIFNCNHIGRMSDYAEMAVEQDMVGYLTANVGGSSVAPYGGAKGVFGTNPLCYAIPGGEEETVIVDFATSFFAGGKLSVGMARGTQLPEGALIDHNGNPSTDPSVYWTKPKGYLLPFGGMVGYKGYGLCMIADLLGGALSGNGCASEAFTNGVLMMALDVSKFRSVDDFKADVDKVVRTCKNIPPQKGYVGLNGETEVLVPGDPERIAEEKHRKEGIYISDITWAKMVEASSGVGVDIDGIE
ncbi:dehydrogenase [Candidatus Bathyarchaeota archaeon]|jgi:uncharacterized oxidoreductase|nr:dehydrogenase [Candidatus Bathyarchaeota archaeon]MDP6049033.1 Ldh family oxidoreductase [Candidatus Bathyarchaeota archaeon]|tara:strand:- start:3553 stop:4614 length:1062 start_codon:yes stop_codon:yes gene_type:complete